MVKPTLAHMENEMYITNGPIIESHQKTQMGPGIPVMNQGIGLRWTNTKSPCYKGNKRKMCPFGFPTGLGLDGQWKTHTVTL